MRRKGWAAATVFWFVMTGPEREVLALLAESGFGYAGVAELLGVTRGDVAALAGAGRLRLAGWSLPEACLPQLARLACVIDGEVVAVPRHHARCPACAAALGVMRRAHEQYKSQLD